MIPKKKPRTPAAFPIPPFWKNPGEGGTFLVLCLSFMLLSSLRPATVFAGDFQPVSLKKYPQLSVVVPNPLDMTKLPAGKTFQVTEDGFILQFYFDGRDVYGIIFKRKKYLSLYVEWCFFKSCEESQYNYIVQIAEAYKPPYDQDFFSIKLPARLSYRFQGMKFFTSE